MYGDTVGFNVVFSGNPYKPLDPAEPRARAGAGERAAGERQPQHRLGRTTPRRAKTLTNALAKAMNEDGITLQAISYTGDDGRRAHRQPPDQPDAEGDRPHRADPGGGAALFGRAPSTSPRSRAGCRRRRSRSTARDSSSRSTGRTPGADELGHDADRRRGLPVLASGSIVWRRDVYPLFDWAVIPVPTVQIFGGNDGFKPQLTAQFRGSVTVSPGLSFSTLIRQPLLGDVRRPGAGREHGHAAAGPQPVGALLCGLGAEAGAADRRLSLQAQPRHLCARLGGYPRAVVRRRQRRGAVEAGRAELGPRRRAQLGGAARLRQPVRLRLLRLQRGDRPRDGLLGHRLDGPRDVALRRALPRRRLGRDGRGAARASPTAGRSAPMPPRPT